ncbi:MAG: hypothetical protein HN867_03425 [Deltaproteobacteria bacterium]|jgi:hypothetical protein|nr:hypothetical protein [Deltaproteobacteria bacterium]MBT7202527.1 hypothetical protein [Deltaproteobacteria bacterium]
MKKFKSLMLAALASAALAAPGFAGGHGSNLVMTGEVVVKATMSSVSPDGQDTTTVQDTSIGDVNAKLTSAVNDSASYAFEFLKDDEGAGKVSFEMTGTATSGDNSIKAFADLSDITGTTGYGDVYIQGSNKTMTVKVGKFGGSENYGGGLGYFRASDLGVGNIEHILVDSFEGVEIDINAGDIQLEVAVPWMSTSAGGYALMTDGADGIAGTADDAAVATNVTGIRPNIKAALGSANISATFYTLSFNAQDGGADTQDKSDTAFQLMGNVATGAATIGLGYTSKTTKDHKTELTPSTLNGFVTVALGGGQTVGASFDILGNGTEDDEATASRFSASYGMPFFVEAVTLKLGAGTSTVSSDDKSKAGSASVFGAEWNYGF